MSKTFCRDDQAATGAMLKVWLSLCLWPVTYQKDISAEFRLNCRISGSCSQFQPFFFQKSRTLFSDRLVVCFKNVLCPRMSSWSHRNGGKWKCKIYCLSWNMNLSTLDLIHRSRHQLQLAQQLHLKYKFIDGYICTCIYIYMYVLWYVCN